MTQTEREMRAEFEGAFRAHWRPEMSIGANSLNVAKIFAWSMWQAATALAKHEGAQAVGWIDEFGNVFPLQTSIRGECDRSKWRKLYTAAPDTRDVADAERYRWLRDVGGDRQDDPDGGIWISAPGGEDVLTGKTADLVIDAARSTANG